MHMRVSPVFFLINTIGADQTLSLGSIMSFANIAAVCLLFPFELLGSVDNYVVVEVGRSRYE